MDIRISKESEVPVHEQLAAQIILSIGTGELKPGDALPSVRALARRLKIHHNTVSQAYQDWVLQLLVVKRRGSRLVVRSHAEQEGVTGTGAKDLDELIDSTVSRAQRQGYSLQQLSERFQQRMLEGPPDHLLVVSDDAGLRVLIPMELQERFSIPIKACSPDDFSSNRSWAVGALVVCAPGQVEKIKPLLPRKRVLVPITYSSADEHIETIRNLTQSSLIALVSISEYFLEVARAVLAPFAGQRHSLREYLLTASQGEFHGAADVFLCDLMAERAVRTRVNGKNVLLYRFISDACLEQLARMLAGSAETAET